MGRGKDLTGQRFGQLLVIEKTDKRANDGSIIWKCKCDCGNEYYNTSSELKRKTHCNNTIHQVINLSNQVFGDLTVLGLDVHSLGKRKIKWMCLCGKCGNVKSIRGNDLTSGKSKSCGCSSAISNGAKKVLDILQTSNYKIQQEISFNDLINDKTGYKLKFDFGLYENDKLVSLVEYDGEQHFYYTNGDKTWNSKQQFENVCYRDNIKNNYCIQNNIPLYRIPYFEIDEIKSIQDIIQDKFKVKEEIKNENSASLN